MKTRTRYDDCRISEFRPYPFKGIVSIYVANELWWIENKRGVKHYFYFAIEKLDLENIKRFSVIIFNLKISYWRLKKVIKELEPLVCPACGGNHSDYRCLWI